MKRPSPSSAPKTRRFHHRLKRLGLPDFETLEDCRRRQRQLLRRHARHKPFHSSIARSLEHCLDHDGRTCDHDACPAACHFAARRLRAAIILGATPLLQDHDGPISFVTVAHPRWALPPGQLRDVNSAAIQQWVRRRFMTIAGAGLVAVGAIDLSLNTALDGTLSYHPHVHLVIAGASKAELRDAFKIPRTHALPHEKLLKVEPIGPENVARCIAYSVKQPYVKKRVAYRGNNGRVQSRHVRLDLAYQLEVDRWLSGLDVDARLLLFGIRRHGRDVVVV